MRYWDIMDWLFFILISSMVIALVFSLFMMTSAHMELQETLEADECQQISRVSTGKLRYCGKACWINERKTEYSCKSGIRIVYN